MGSQATSPSQIIVLPKGWWGAAIYCLAFQGNWHELSIAE